MSDAASLSAAEPRRFGEDGLAVLVGIGVPIQELRDELKAPAEPLLPIEKKLIGWSLGIGVATLVFLVTINRFLPVS
jgi:hypothetical protein